VGVDVRTEATDILLQWGPVVVTGIRRPWTTCADAGHRHASMGSGRGDRNQVRVGRVPGHAGIASMGSGRGDRNQLSGEWKLSLCAVLLQWGPVVVTGIRARG